MDASHSEFWMIVIKNKSALYEQQFWQYSWVTSLCVSTDFKKEHADIFQTAELRSPTHGDSIILIENFLLYLESQGLEVSQRGAGPKNSGC